MHRIDTATATVDNKFTIGNPGAGIPATAWGEEWPNSVQEELCNVVEAAGITLDKPNNAQLLAALRNLSFSTGDVKLTLKAVADTGWVMANDGTIGSAASGSTTRANADAEPLYTLIWNNITNTNAPIYDSAGGASTRGASAAADFAANKRLALTKTLGRALAIAGAGAGLTTRALGSVYGQETVALSTSQMPVHSHTITDPTHSHTIPAGGSNAPVNWPGGFDGAGSTTTNAASTGITGTNNAGSGVAHENMQPSSFLNAMIKL